MPWIKLKVCIATNITKSRFFSYFLLSQHPDDTIASVLWNFQNDEFLNKMKFTLSKINFTLNKVKMKSLYSNNSDTITLPPALKTSQ